jgi:chloramphenicol-sensitive protein RarD
MAQEASLGYFINPLFNFIFAVIFLGEKMRGMILLSCAVAVIGVALITIQTGVLPLPSLGLALTFSVYGLIKKKIAISPISSITLEALVILPVALVYVLAFSRHGFLTYPAHINLLIASAGLVTAIPLLLFSDSARKLPYITIGFLQYISPTIMFLIAIFIFRENISLLKLLGFCFIWAAILIFSAASIRRK